jgi:hypothetical protein
MTICRLPGMIGMRNAGTYGFTRGEAFQIFTHPERLLAHAGHREQVGAAMAQGTNLR